MKDLLLQPQTLVAIIYIFLVTGFIYVLVKTFRARHDNSSKQKPADNDDLPVLAG